MNVNKCVNYVIEIVWRKKQVEKLELFIMAVLGTRDFKQMLTVP